MLITVHLKCRQGENQFLIWLVRHLREWIRWIQVCGANGTLFCRDEVRRGHQRASACEIAAPGGAIPQPPGADPLSQTLAPRRLRVHAGHRITQRGRLARARAHTAADMRADPWGGTAVGAAPERLLWLQGDQKRQADARGGNDRSRQDPCPGDRPSAAPAAECTAWLSDPPETRL